MDKHRLVLFGGTFGHDDNDPGRKSGYIQKFADELEMQDNCSLITFNGGRYYELLDLTDYIHDGSVLLWFPNISNEMTKLLPPLRAARPNLKFIISKNNLVGKYNDDDLRLRREAANAIALVEFYPIDHGFGAGIHTANGVNKGYDSPQDLARNILGVL